MIFVLGEFLIDLRLLAFYLFICSETRSHFAILASLALTRSGLSRLSAGTTGMCYQIQWHCPWWPLTLLEQCLGLTQYSQKRKSTQQSCWVFCYGLGVYLYFKNLRINSKICHIWSGSDFWRIWGGIRMRLNFRELNTEPSAGSMCGIRMDSFSPRGCQAWKCQTAISFLRMQFSPKCLSIAVVKVNTITKHVACLPSGWTCFLSPPLLTLYSCFSGRETSVKVQDLLVPDKMVALIPGLFNSFPFHSWPTK